MAPVCSNCGGTEFVWAGELKTGGRFGQGPLALRSGGELPLGTRICRGCGHADLFLRDVAILQRPHHWRPGEFTPISSPARPAVRSNAPPEVPAPAPVPEPPEPPVVLPSPATAEPDLATPPVPEPAAEPLPPVPEAAAPIPEILTDPVSLSPELSNSDGKAPGVAGEDAGPRETSAADSLVEPVDPSPPAEAPAPRKTPARRRAPARPRRSK